MPRLPTRSADIQPGAISGGRRAGVEDTNFVDMAPLGRTVQNVAEQQFQRTEEDESRKVLVQQAEIRAKYAKRLDEAATSGEDLGKIKEELDADISKVSEGVQTRKGADAAALHAANNTAVFDNQANNIAVTRASIQARVDGAKFLSSLGSTLATNGPAYLPQAEQDVDAFIATLTRVPPEKRDAYAQELKNNLNVAAARSLARSDPNAAIKAVEDGQFVLDPAQRQAILDRAKETQNAMRAEDARVKAEAEVERLRKSEQSLDGYFKQMMTGGFSMKAALSDETLTARAREHIILLAESRAKEARNEGKRSDPVVERNLWMAIHAPDGDARKIYSATPIFEAVQRGDINTNTANQLNAMVANQKDENNRSIGGHLNGLMSIVGRSLSQDPRYIGQPGIVAEIQMDYQNRVYKKTEALRAEKKDPMEAFNPASKDFVGSREFIQGSIDRVKGNTPATALPRAGTVLEFGGKKWEFKGGDPAVQSNYKEVK
jgi:hypothetical protein